VQKVAANFNIPGQIHGRDEGRPQLIAQRSGPGSP
jgi:hypothetical protein